GAAIFGQYLAERGTYDLDRKTAGGGQAARKRNDFRSFGDLEDFAYGRAGELLGAFGERAHGFEGLVHGEGFWRKNGKKEQTLSHNAVPVSQVCGTPLKSLRSILACTVTFMFTATELPVDDKPRFYAELAAQARALLHGETDRI